MLKKLYLMFIWQPLHGQSKRSRWSKAFLFYFVCALMMSALTYYFASLEVYRLGELTVRSGKITKISKKLTNIESNNLVLATNNGDYKYRIHSVDLKNLKVGDMVKVYSSSDIRGDFVEEIRNLDGKILSKKYDYDERKKIQNSGLVQNTWKFILKLAVLFLIIIALINFKNSEKPNNFN